MATNQAYASGSDAYSNRSTLTDTVSNQSIPSVSSSVKKGRKWMKFLCWVEFVLAIFALTLGSACTGVNSGRDRNVCTFGTGIWVGLLSLCCAAIGLVSIQPGIYQRKFLLVYFLMCIFGALASVVLVGMSCMWMEKATKYYNTDSQNYELASVTLNACLLVAAICQTTCTFLSAVLLAHYYWGWCCRSSVFSSPIAYVRAEDVADCTQDVNMDQPRPHLYARRSDPYYTNSLRTSELGQQANGNRYFY